MLLNTRTKSKIPESQLSLCQEFSFYQLNIVGNLTATDYLVQAKIKTRSIKDHAQVLSDCSSLND